MKILVVNAGSSTVKLALYDLGEGSPADASDPLWKATGEINWEDMTLEDQERVVTGLLTPCRQAGKLPVELKEVALVGHRVVHGGDRYATSVIVDEEVKADIERFAQLAPVHNPVNLRGILVAERLFPSAKQVAVFDTAFHASMPETNCIYPVPYSWYQDWAVRRYGFHGISHAYCSRRAAQLLGRESEALRSVSCHLGNGCSLAAVSAGVCRDTTMGFTPLEGLMMGSRSGSVDPGLVIYLLRNGKCSLEDLDNTLNYDSGLEGVSGISSDMREIEAAMSCGNERARLAFDIFVHRLRQGIAAMAASLGGVDALIFTAGIGENSAAVRTAACDRLGFLGVKIDPGKNAAAVGASDTDIAAASSAVNVLVIRTREDLEIARECLRVAGKEKG